MSDEQNIPKKNSELENVEGAENKHKNKKIDRGKKEELQYQSQPTLEPQPPNLPAAQAGVKPQTTTDKSESETMEVHKHPHHVTHKKKWHEYALEFLMIFLAVFLGFVAENWREELVNNRKEKEYIESYIEDLKLDTFQLRIAILIRERIQSSCDSLILLLKSSDREII